MWILQLNDMRSSNVEIVEPVVKAETREELERFVESERVEPYRDGRWNKSFRRGGPLEWFNRPLSSLSRIHFLDVGTEDECAERVRERYRDRLAEIPLVNVSSAPSC